MIPSAVKGTIVCMTAFVLLLLAGGTARARAENRALDLNLARQDDRTRCVIRLDSPPVYALTPEGGNRSASCFGTPTPPHPLRRGSRKPGPRPHPTRTSSRRTWAFDSNSPRPSKN